MPSQRAPYDLMVEYGVDLDPVICCANSINMYLAPSKSNQQQKVLLPMIGYGNPRVVGDGPIRAQFVFNEKEYVVSGDTIYEVDTSLVATAIATLTTDSGFVRIAANETQVGICDGVNLVIWDTVSSTATTVNFAGMGITIIPGDLTMMDNFFIVIDDNKNVWYASNLGNGTVFDPLAFGTFNSTSDQLSACVTLKRRIFLFGKTSTQIAFNAGQNYPGSTVLFPFQIDTNSFFQHGVTAKKSICQGFEMLFYLATSEDGYGGVMMATGTTNPQKISSREIDILLESFQNRDDAEGVLFQKNGTIFYQLSFSQDNATILLVYYPSLQAMSWHVLQRPDGDRHIAVSHSFFNGQHYIGDFETNNIYELSNNFLTYGNDLIRCIVTGRPFTDPNNRRIRVDRFELQTIPGLPDGTLANQENYDQINQLVTENKETNALLSVSKNGGRTFGLLRRASLGKVGEYNERTIWRKLGVNKGRRIVFMIEYPYESHFYIIGANVCYEVLPQ